MKLQPPSAQDRNAVLLQWLRQGAVLHQQGQLDEAEPYYRAILKAQPAHLDAKHLLGVLLLQREQFDEAVRWLKQVVKANPASANAQLDFANTLAKLERFAEALSGYDAAIALDLATPELYTNRASVLAKLGRLPDALSSCKQALLLNPNHGQAHFVRGNALKDLNRLEEAIESYSSAIAADPTHADAFNNRAAVETRLDRFEAALSSSDAAIALKPDYAEAHNNRAIALIGLKRPAEALNSLERALSLRPTYPEAWNNRGLAYKQLDRLEEELQSYERALELRANFSDALNNRGIVLNMLGYPREALASLAAGLKLVPDDVEARFSRGLIRLLTGDLANGWRDYDLRFRKKSPLTLKLQQMPAWTGESLKGRRLIVYDEQGLGDIIQFVRYVPRLVDLGAEVTFLVTPALHRLLKPIARVARLVADPPEEQFDFQSPLLSLPSGFATTLETIPAPGPCLVAEPDRVAAWRDRIGSDGFKIGVVWQGNPEGSIDAGRSYPVRLLEPVGRLPGVRLISLQKTHGLDQLATLPAGLHLETLGADFDAGPDAFVDTAAVMESLDLVISSDTSVAHVAGSLGRPAWIALKHVPDWRWLLDRTDSPWYPSLKLYRQAARDQWPGVFERMAADLAQMLQSERS